MFLSQTFPESRPTKGISRAVKKKKNLKKKGISWRKGWKHTVFTTQIVFKAVRKTEHADA